VHAVQPIAITAAVFDLPPSKIVTGDGQFAAHAEHTSTGLRSAEDEALRALPDTEIISALRALPAGYRMAVYYADVEGLSCKHISEIMHTPVGTVVSRLHRGRRRLRVLLTGVATDRGIVRGRCLQMAPAPSRADVVRSAICLEPRSANARCRGVPDPFRTR
jgi:hypothetical protein